MSTKTQSIESRSYWMGKYTVCRRVRASFSSEMLPAGAVKGLINCLSFVLLLRTREDGLFSFDPWNVLTILYASLTCMHSDAPGWTLQVHLPSQDYAADIHSKMSGKFLHTTRGKGQSQWVRVWCSPPAANASIWPTAAWSRDPRTPFYVYRFNKKYRPSVMLMFGLLRKKKMICKSFVVVVVVVVVTLWLSFVHQSVTFP